MADPFSTIVGTASLVDVSWRLLKYLKDVQAAALKLEDEIDSLLRDIESLISINEAIKDVFASELSSSSQGISLASTGHVESLWRNTGRSLRECRTLVELMEELVLSIAGRGAIRVKGKFDGFRKQMKKQSKDEKFRDLRQQLGNYEGGLQILLSAINLAHTQKARLSHDQSFDQSARTIQSLRQDISSLQPRLGYLPTNDLHDSLLSAAAVVYSVSPNKHFDVPQTVSSIFTGRKDLLEDLRINLIDSSTHDGTKTQKRFVIYGLGGSGKTQFCCKFAQDNRHRFWGVFWVDATSEERATQSFNRIARIGGRDPNERAAKDWLSTLEFPWLLIIDSADDPSIAVDKYFPGGERGHILVTTRNPANKVHGTVGPRYMQFTELRDDDANALLLKAACEPIPWDVDTLGSAAVVAKALGYLPLALVHAGSAIMSGLCNLGNYMYYFERSWQRVRRARSSSSFREAEDSNMNIYSSYEIIFLGLEAKGTEETRDAIEILKLSSFLHHENIRIDVFTRAAQTPRLKFESQQKEKAKENAVTLAPQARTWTQRLREMGFLVAEYVMRDRSPPVLPNVLHDIEKSGPLQDVRLRVALKQLTQMSLITYSPMSDTYSMHPLVHTWVRERPEMSTAEQAVWCQAAANPLAQSVPLPPLGSTESDETYYRDLLTHVDHVRDRQKEIQERIRANQKGRSWFWPRIPEPQFDRLQAQRFARFSRVYGQGARWEDAEKLQVAVKDFVFDALGPRHPGAILIMLALSGTYWQLGRGNDAADLQEAALKICVTSLGELHPRTLKVGDTLGESCMLQGRFKESLKLHDQAVTQMTKMLGPDHEDTLKAIDNLGTIHNKYFRHRQAKALHSKAVDGMKRVLGVAHLNTMDNLAMTYLSIGGDLLEPAESLMAEVVEQRTAKLGKEHPYTLWALCNLARVKSALGALDEAERIMRSGNAIAERNLGATHIGTLFGRTHLGENLVRQGRYQEAEDLFLDLMASYRHIATAVKGEHPDRLYAMLILVDLYRVQDRIEDALRLCDDISQALDTIGGQQHPFSKRVQKAREGLLETRRGDGDDGAAAAAAKEQMRDRDPPPLDIRHLSTAPKNATF